MSTADQNHIPPDVLEEAACGHLPPDRRAVVEAHCAVCTQCKAAYDEELRIARGTRSWARAALKSRVATRVGTTQRIPVPWTRMLATAAALLVLAGTGIVYQWLHVPPDPTANTVISKVSTDSLTAPGAGTATRELADARTLSAVPSSPAMKESVRDESRAERTKRERDAIPQAPAAAPVASEEPLATVPDAQLAVGSLQTSMTSELIVWGNVIAADGVKDKGSRTQEITAEDAAMEARGAQMQGVRKTNARPHARFTVDQEVILARYRRDAGSRPGQMPARISRSADTVHIVLLVDSLMPDAVIRAATVRAFAPDSVQVHFQGTTIGFTTPPGFLP